MPDHQSPTPPTLHIFFLDTGYCLAWENHLLQHGQHRRIACHALVALLQHPTHGWLLWDTGYAPRMLDATRQFPFSLYGRATPLRLDPELSVVHQLTRWNLQPSDINYVILSHFHADHLAGLLDFPHATLIATRSAYEGVASLQGIRALRRAFIPALMPSDFIQRARLLPSFSGPALPGLGATYDVFEDGSLLLVALPGHARGQLGMLAHTTRGRILLAADGCWLRRSITEQRPPARITNLFTDDPAAIRSTIVNLHTFSQAEADTIIIPTHCPDTFAEVIAQ